jgi:hypothetical protein
VDAQGIPKWEASMSVSVVVSVASALTALVAVALSMRQVRLMERQAMLPVVLESFREARSSEWFQARDFIYERLAAEFSPEHGVTQLPEPARSSVREVGFLFDNFGLLIAHRVASEDLVLGFFGEHIDEIWRILEPYIRKEAERRGLHYMVFFEDLVVRSRSRGSADIRHALGLRSLTA